MLSCLRPRIPCRLLPVLLLLLVLLLPLLLLWLLPILPSVLMSCQLGTRKSEELG